MSRVSRYTAATVIVAAACWASFNIGFDYGSDTGWCVGFDMAGGHRAVPVEDDEFCTRAQPENAPVQHRLRMAWLTVTGDLP